MESRQHHSRILDPEFLLNAYRQGFFPMADSRQGEIHWYSPDPRAILKLDNLKVSRTLRRTIRNGIFDTRVNTSFEAVIASCSERHETWISGTIIKSYLNLHTLGFAHSVETWSEGTLAGGLYGVAIGAAFFGESMFSRKKDASKVALVSLVERLRERGFELLDTQFLTPHLATLGATEIPRSEYLWRLQKAVNSPRTFI